MFTFVLNELFLHRKHLLDQLLFLIHRYGLRKRIIIPRIRCPFAFAKVALVR